MTQSKHKLKNFKLFSPHMVIKIKIKINFPQLIMYAYIGVVQGKAGWPLPDLQIQARVEKETRCVPTFKDYWKIYLSITDKVTISKFIC